MVGQSEGISGRPCCLCVTYLVTNPAYEGPYMPCIGEFQQAKHVMNSHVLRQIRYFFRADMGEALILQGLPPTRPATR